MTNKYYRTLLSGVVFHLVLTRIHSLLDQVSWFETLIAPRRLISTVIYTILMFFFFDRSGKKG
ncbi:hypothetical protein [Streptococcus sp. E17BB]|uniref:hypothetical protein n=1 Tax=Streptococcus sp. E17BB TaxID=3278714 RepID=UPI00359CFF12